MRYGLANGRRIGEHLCRERPPDINLNVNSNVTFWPFMYTCMHCVNEAAPIYLWAGIVAYFGSSDARTFLHHTITIHIIIVIFWCCCPFYSLSSISFWDSGYWFLLHMPTSWLHVITAARQIKTYYI